MSSSGSTLPGRGRIGGGAVGAVLAALAGLALVLPPLDLWLVPLSYDAVFWLRDDIPTRGVLVVYMDEESHRRLGQPWDGKWDRSWHARLIERLGALGARVIAFDVMFPDPGEPAQDEQLVNAARAHGRVALAAMTKPVLTGDGRMIGWQVQRPFPALRAVTTAGVVTQAEEDRSIRRHYFNPTITNLPSLAWSAAWLAGRAPPAPWAERWINYYGPPDVLPHLSYFELFETNEASRLTALVSNQVVFVGARFSDRFTGGMETDDFSTPYTRGSARKSPGVEVNATCYLNLVRQDWLNRLPAAWEAGLVLLAGLGLGFGLGRLRVVKALGVGLIAAVILTALAIGSAWVTHVWVPWGVVVVAQLPLALASAIVGQSRRLIRERRAFEQALALTSEGRSTTRPAGVKPAGDSSSGRLEPPIPVAPVPVPDFLREPEAVGRREDLPRIPDHELIRCIGRGGYGEVWLARDILGSFHAVKLLRLGAFTNAGPLLTEFEGLRRYTPVSRSHPGLVHVLHVGRDQARACLFYVMELADDEGSGRFDPETYVPRTLARDLGRRGRLPLPEVLAMGIQLADALEHLHRHQLVHRDVKPANIVFVKGQPKLADAGLVTDAILNGDSLTFLGTPGRIAPEGAGTPGADVFSLGKVLYEAGLGMELDRFPELPPDMIAPGAGRDLFDLNRIIMKACDGDFRRRHGSAAELRDGLAALRQRLTGRLVSS